jgi:hypothetical protein
MTPSAPAPRGSKEKFMKPSYGVAAVLAIVGAAALPGGVAKAATPLISSQADIFDARGDSAASTYCIDAPAILIGQQICGGFLRSTVTATSDPRGFALAGLAPVPKLSSVPLLIPSNVQGIPVPEQVQEGLKQIKFSNIPSQCQAAFPELNEGDSDQTCGGPTYGDGALGFIGSGVNAHVTSTGDEANPTQTRTIGDSRAANAELPGLQSSYDDVRARSESGLNTNGIPTGSGHMDAHRISIASGLFAVEGIVSDTKVAFAGTKDTTAVSSSFKYASASFAGIPVDITPTGLVLATEKVPADQAKALTDQLNTALANNNGFGVKLLPAPPVEVTDSLARASSGGIQVNYRGSTGTDVVYTQTIGVTWAQVSAVAASGLASAASTEPAAGAAPSAALPTGSDVDTAAAPGADLPSTDFALGTTPSATDLAGLDSTVAAAPTQTVQTFGNQALLTGFPGVPESLSSSRVKDIYPVFCLLMLATLVVARFRRVPFSKAG